MGVNLIDELAYKMPAVLLVVLVVPYKFWNCNVSLVRTTSRALMVLLRLTRVKQNQEITGLGTCTWRVWSWNRLISIEIVEFMWWRSCEASCVMYLPALGHDAVYTRWVVNAILELNCNFVSSSWIFWL